MSIDAAFYKDLEQESLNLLKKGYLKPFDAHSADNGCQTRAAIFLDNKEKEVGLLVLARLLCKVAVPGARPRKINVKQITAPLSKTKLEQAVVLAQSQLSKLSIAYLSQRMTELGEGQLVEALKITKLFERKVSKVTSSLEVASIYAETKALVVILEKNDRPILIKNHEGSKLFRLHTETNEVKQDEPLLVIEGEGAYPEDPIALLLGESAKQPQFGFVDDDSLLEQTGLKDEIEAAKSCEGGFEIKHLYASTLLEEA